MRRNGSFSKRLKKQKRRNKKLSYYTAARGGTRI